MRELNDLGLGINVGEVKVSLLLYADDIVVVAYNEQDMQVLLDGAKDGEFFTEKSKAVHFRRGRRERSEFQFRIGDTVEIASKLSVHSRAPCVAHARYTQSKATHYFAKLARGIFSQ